MFWETLEVNWFELMSKMWQPVIAAEVLVCSPDDWKLLWSYWTMKYNVCYLYGFILDVEGASCHREGSGVATEWGRCYVLALRLLLYQPAYQPRFALLRWRGFVCLTYLLCILTSLILAFLSAGRDVGTMPDQLHASLHTLLLFC